MNSLPSQILGRCASFNATMLKLISVIFILFFTSPLDAQKNNNFKISGIVNSGYSGKPIPEASINYSKKFGVLTDSSGRFSIHGLTAGRYTLSFTAPGFENKDTVISITNSDTYFIWVINAGHCSHYNKDRARIEIKQGKPKLLIQGGIASIVYAKDKLFMSKYGVTFHDLGCVVMDAFDCLSEYNQVTFQFLDANFGRKWRKEIRKDIIGL